MVKGGRKGVYGTPRGVCWWLSTGWLLWLSVIRVWERRAPEGFQPPNQTGYLKKIIQPNPKWVLQWPFRRRRRRRRRRKKYGSIVPFWQVGETKILPWGDWPQANSNMLIYLKNCSQTNCPKCHQKNKKEFGFCSCTNFSALYLHP